MVTKRLIKKSKTWSKFYYLKFLFYAFLCFVLLESSGGYAKTPNAFIFSLNNFETLAPFVSKVKLQKIRKAIYRHSYYGPKFGNDLVICLDTVNIKDSTAGLGTYYSAPPAVQDRLKVLAGTEYFSPDQLEVCYLDTSR